MNNPSPMGDENHIWYCRQNGLDCLKKSKKNDLSKFFLWQILINGAFKHLKYCLFSTLCFDFNFNFYFNFEFQLHNSRRHISLSLFRFFCRNTLPKTKISIKFSPYSAIGKRYNQIPSPIRKDLCVVVVVFSHKKIYSDLSMHICISSISGTANWLATNQMCARGRKKMELSGNLNIVCTQA